MYFLVLPDGLGLPIVAPIHLVQRRDSHLGPRRGGVWGMTTSTTPHTQLESLLLFRGIAQFGLEIAAFPRIAEALKNNNLIKNAATYDARRLNPESLQELFLRLLRDELKTESGDPPGPDGALPPAPAKSNGRASPLPTLGDARQHGEKIQSAYSKLQDAYMRHAVHDIKQLEHQFDLVQKEIRDLEKAGDANSGPRPQSPNGVQTVPAKHDAGPANGAGPSPLASPKPTAQVPISPSLPHQPLRPLQPLLPQPTPRPDGRNGPSPPQQAVPEKTGPGPRSPALTYPQAVHSPQPGQQEISRTSAAKPSETPKLSNGAPQVLQAPQGAPPFQPPSRSPAPPPIAEDLQRPDGVVGPRQSPVLPLANAQPPAQGQLKWEPPYQPNAGAPRQTDLQHHNATIFPTLPQAMPTQQAPYQPQPPQPRPSPLPGQSHRPLPQQVLIPPHSTSQFAPPLQSPPVRSLPDSVNGSIQHRQPPPLPAAGLSQGLQPQSPYQPPPYPGYPASTPAHGSPIHTAQPRAHPSPAHPGPGRSPVIPSPSVPPAAALPRPSHGPTAPHPQRPQPLNSQPSLPYGQQTAPQAAPSLGPSHPDAARIYNSPYQPPRPAAVDRIHPRLPVAATPTPPARFSSVTPAPKTPAMALRATFIAGSGTKWISTPTPSTPKPGVEFRLGYDNVPSPAFEPVSPVSRPPVPPSAVPLGAKDRQMAERTQTDAPAAKRKPSWPQSAHQAQIGIPPRQPAASPAATQSASPQTKGLSQSAVEPEPPKVKHEREDLTPTPVRTSIENRMTDVVSESLPPPGPPKVVLWTRSFNKVCGSAMEQIVHHRSANMFAQPIREKDAPGYHKVIKYPQDLKSIRAAINHGNRAAAQAAAALPGGDPGSSSVWLPRTEELVPPRSIINSSQLDRELAHMFSNAVMYNPDPYHGPGPVFLNNVDEIGEGVEGGAHHDSGVLGYKVDEFGVVNDARAMFVGVEKLLSELRSAEIQRGAPPGGATGTSTRQASVLGAAAGGPESGADEDEEDECGGRGQEETGC
ncbi:hypothetical protein BT67DRAFT_448708 [Trichocladium antarcticum]|uniref:Bromo domain-containing protein n=1 Tax=Trichocladium antarcticum TaxID=1450529 RepID=A0AAN6UN71_9PEZI|nr:hypothetical protein BT67DRAFT_448708 [Trichocladium antarcticum]